MTVPVCSTVSLNHVALSPGDGQVGACDHDGNEVVVDSVAECLSFVLVLVPEMGGCVAQVTVLPAKVTVVPSCRPVRSMDEFAGA